MLVRATRPSKARSDLRASAARTAICPTSARCRGSTAICSCTEWDRTWSEADRTASRRPRCRTSHQAKAPAPANGAHRLCGAWPTLLLIFMTAERPRWMKQFVSTAARQVARPGCTPASARRNGTRSSPSCRPCVRHELSRCYVNFVRLHLRQAPSGPRGDGGAPLDVPCLRRPVGIPLLQPTHRGATLGPMSPAERLRTKNSRPSVSTLSFENFSAPVGGAGTKPGPSRKSPRTTRTLDITFDGPIEPALVQQVISRRPCCGPASGGERVGTVPDLPYPRFLADVRAGSRSRSCDRSALCALARNRASRFSGRVSSSFLLLSPPPGAWVRVCRARGRRWPPGWRGIRVISTGPGVI